MPHINDDGQIVLCDGKQSCWGDDQKIADALSDLPDCDEDGTPVATYEDIWEALSDFPSDI